MKNKGLKIIFIAAFLLASGFSYSQGLFSPESFFKTIISLYGPASPATENKVSMSFGKELKPEIIPESRNHQRQYLK
jgi:hypothetical protein